MCLDTNDTEIQSRLTDENKLPGFGENDGSF